MLRWPGRVPAAFCLFVERRLPIGPISYLGRQLTLKVSGSGERLSLGITGRPRHSTRRGFFVLAALILALLIGLANEPFLHLLSHPEVRGRPFWNRYDHSRPGITASASFMNLDREYSESA
jgi:hypothetical protein